jgi:transposase
VPVYLPAYCPELNPIERWWQELKDAVSNTLYGTLDALRERLDPNSPPGTTDLSACARLPATPTSSTRLHHWINLEKWYNSPPAD